MIWFGEFIKRRWLFATGLFFSLIVGFGLWQLIFSPGTIGLSGDWPIPPMPWQNEKLGLNSLFFWNKNYFGFEQSRQFGNYVEQLMALSAYLGRFGGAIISKYPIFLLPIAGLTMTRLARRLGLSRLASFLAGFLYLVTPLFFDSLVEGYLKFFPSYVFLPEFLGDLWFLPKRRSAGEILKTAVVFGLIASSLNFLIIGALLLLFSLIWHLGQKNDWSQRGRLVLSGLGFLLGPIFLQPTLLILLFELLGLSRSADLSDQLSTAIKSHVILGHPSLLSALSLQGGRFTNHFLNSISQIPWLKTVWIASRILLLCLIVVSLKVKKRRPLVLFLLALSIFSLLLAKGVNPPLGQLNQWLYDNFAPMTVLRNSSYALALTTLAFSLLFAIAADWLLETNRRFLILPILFFIPLVSSSVYYLPYIRDKLVPYRAPKDSQIVYQRLRENPADFRIMHAPTNQPMSLENNGFGRETSPGVNPFTQTPAKPVFWTGANPSAWPALSAYLINLLNFGQTDNFGFSAATANIGQIIFDRNFTSRYPSFIVNRDNPWLFELFKKARLEKILPRQKDLSLRERLGRVSVFQNERAIGPVMAKKAALLVGDFDLIDRVSELSVYQSPPPLLFAAEQNELSDEAIEQVSALWLTEDHEQTLTTAFLPARYKYDLGRFIPPTDADANEHFVAAYLNQWWWKEPVANSTSDYILSETEDRLNFEIRLEETGDYRVLLQAFRSPAGSQLELSLDDQKLEPIVTGWSESKGYHWFDLGRVELPSGKLSGQLESGPGFNAVSRLIVVPEDRWRQAENRASRLIESKPIIYLAQPRTEPKTRPQTPKKAEFEIRTSGEGRQSENLILNPDFKQGLKGWQIENPCQRCFEFSLREDGQKFLTLQTDRVNREVELTTKLQAVTKEGDYELGFDYFMAQGSDSPIGFKLEQIGDSERQAVIAGYLSNQIGQRRHDQTLDLKLEQIGDSERQAVIAGYLGKHVGWRHYNQTLSLKAGKKTELGFFAVGDKEGSTIGLTNIVLREKAKPLETIFIEKSLKVEPDRVAISDYQRLSPTRAKMTIEKTDSPFLLTFLESKNPNWQVLIDQRPVAAERLTVNHFAQGFLMPPIGERVELELNFKNQTRFALANLISLLFLLFLLILWFNSEKKPAGKK